MTTVVGLDLSLTAAGVAVLTDDPTRIPYKLPPTNATPWQQQSGVMWPIALRAWGIDGHQTDGYLERNRRIRAVARGVMDIVKAAGPIDHAGTEAMLPVTKTFYSYGDRWALWHSVFGSLDVLDIPCAVVVNTTAHQFTTGKGRVSEDKREVIEATSSWWPNIEIGDHNIGDAVGIAAMVGMHCGMKLPFRPGARHYNAIHTVEWPGHPRRPKTWAELAKAKRARRG